MLYKDKIILSVIFLGLSILIFFRLEKTLSFPDQSWSLIEGEKIKITSEIVQKFEADHNGLTRIKILFGNSDVSPGGTFDFKIYDENCQDIIREINLDITSLDSGNTTDFVFPKISDSKNKIFCLKLSYEQKKGGKKANVFINENRMVQNKFFSINGEEKASQSLSMRPAYRNENLWQDSVELNQRMSQYKPLFLKHYFLSIIIFGFIILSILLVAILII
ncbi:MAG: hypothetical protein Q7U36_04680 [bacterium]|nr:hypothetical protein [bacterium]